MIKIGNFLDKCSDFVFSSTILGSLILKTGISPIGSEFVGWLRIASKNFPRNVNYLHAAPLPLLLMSVTNFPSDSVWWMLNFAIFVFWICLTMLFLKSYYKSDFKFYCAFFLALPQVVVSMTMIGHIDIFTLLGATIAAFRPTPFFIILGALLAGGGNADQAIATSVILLFLIAAGSDRAKRVGKVWIPISAFFYLAVKMIFHVNAGVSISEIIFKGIRNVILNSLGIWHLEFFSILSIGWFFFLIFIWPNLITFRQKLLVCVAVVVAPFMMTFIILDGTRVGVSVGYLPLLIVILEYGSIPKYLRNNTKLFYSFYVMAMIFIPTIIVGNGSNLRLPYSKLILHFFHIS